MMKLITTLLFSLLLCACSSNQNNANIHCHIEGIVHDRPESDKLLLYVGVDGGIALSSQPYQKIKIRNGKFSCDIYLDKPQYCELVFEDERQNGHWQAIDFVAGNSPIVMNLYPISDFNKTSIESTGETAEYHSYKLKLRDLQIATNEVREKLKSEGRSYTEEYTNLISQIESIENDSKKQKELIERMQSMTEEQTYTPEMLAERKQYSQKRKAALLEIIGGEPTIAKLAILASLMKYNLPEPEFISIFNNTYATKYPENPMTQFCHRQIGGLGLQVGSHYTDFEAPDLEGNMHRLSDMVSDAKLVMLDLWASWCAPCRQASMEMIPLYEQYKDKGFMIIGVARESKSKDAMEKAIKKDGYTWPQLIELDDRANIWSLYGCGNAAGRRILFDADGKILAFDPTIEELTAFVKNQLNTNN